MIEGSHRVKRVCGTDRTGSDSVRRFLKRRIGVPYARKHAPFAGVTNDLCSTGEFRSDSHHLQRTAARVQNALEKVDGRCNEVPRWMNSAFRCADEWPFEVNSEGTRA